MMVIMIMKLIEMCISMMLQQLVYHYMVLITVMELTIFNNYKL